MKLTKSLSVFVLTFLLSATPAFAQSVTPTRVPRPTRVEERREIRQEIRQEIKNDRQELKEEIKTDRQELRATITQDKLTLRRNNATKIAENIISKLEKRFEYLGKVKDRLQSKIDSLKATKNMTEAQAKLNTYSATKYTTDLTALKTKIAEINTAEKPMTVIPTLRSAAKLVQDDLKDLHQVLVDTLKLIVKAPKTTE